MVPFFVEKLKRWKVNIPAKLNDGARAQKYFATRDEARIFCAQLENQKTMTPAGISPEEWSMVLAHRKKRATCERMTVGDAAEAWLSARERDGLSGRTMSDYKWRVRWLVENIGAKRQVAPVSQIALKSPSLASSDLMTGWTVTPVTSSASLHFPLIVKQ